MRYVSGREIQVGDVVQIDTTHHGRVVGDIAKSHYLPPSSIDQWGHLRSGILIDTSFGGLVHYATQAHIDAERIELSGPRD